MTWNNNDMSDSQYMKQLNVWRNRDTMKDINREIKKMRKLDKNKNNPVNIKDRSLLSKILIFWK